jgi:hypothetical protein
MTETQAFTAREERAEWGLPCNQSAGGGLWTGKGYVLPFEEMFGGDTIARVVKSVLTEHRANRMGRFWFHPRRRTVTMMVGEAHLYKYITAKLAAAETPS